MKICVEYQVIWDCNVIVDADDHAAAAAQVRVMGNAEHYDNCTDESTKVFDTTELFDSAACGDCGTVYDVERVGTVCSDCHRGMIKGVK